MVPLSSSDSPRRALFLRASVTILGFQATHSYARVRLPLLASPPRGRPRPSPCCEDQNGVTSNVGGRALIRLGFSTSREMPLRQQRCLKGMRGSPRVACFPALPGSGAGNGVVRTAMPVLLCTPPHRALQDDGAVTRRATGWSRCGAARRRWRNVREATCGYECRGENGITRNVGLSGRRDARDKKATTDARVSSVANWRCVPHKIVDMYGV